MTKQMTFGFVCACLIASPPVAQGETIYSTLGPGDSFRAGVGWSVFFDSTDDANQNLAVSFVVAHDYQLSLIELALGVDFSILPVHLAVDEGGAPGGIIETFLVDLRTAGGLVTLVSSLNPNLEAGKTYWIFTEANRANRVDTAWFDNDQGLNGGLLFSLDEAASWLDLGPFVTPAFRVSGVRASVIPEPASMISAIVGAACLGFVGLRRRARG